MSDKTDQVVKLRLEYDKDNNKAEEWLNAENTLSDDEFKQYMSDYRKAKTNQDVD